MFKFLNNKMKKKGQSTLEYAILMIIIIGALLAIQQYIKRAYQGRLKSASDDIGDQFSPGNTNVTKTKFSSGGKVVDSFVGGVTRSDMLQAETTNTTMVSNIINVQREFWGN